MKNTLFLGCLAFFLSFSVTAQASWDNAAAEVEHTIETMIEQVATYRGEVDADLEPLYASLSKLTQESVDYPYLAKFVMGKYYRRANDEQKADFLQVFQRTLIKTYGKTLVSFDIESYEMQKNKTQSPKPDKQKVVVKVSSKAGKKYTLINYMVLKEGRWKLVNIVLDGFNLRSTFKNQFAKKAQSAKNDIGKAIKDWADSVSKDSK